MGMATGGGITASSELGRGAAFIVTLPAAQTCYGENLMTQSNILIIEDDRKLAEIYSVALQSVGFETKVINDGRKVFEALAETLPTIIILDLHLPHVSGLDILQQLQADDRLSDTRIIVATADARAGDMLRDTADLILLKPVSIEQLIGLARRLTQPE